MFSNHIIGEKAPILKKNLLKELRVGTYGCFKEKTKMPNNVIIFNLHY